MASCGLLTRKRIMPHKNQAHWANYNKELPGMRILLGLVASRDEKHAEGGALKPQAVRLTAVASWREQRRRGSERPVGSRRRECRPRASTRCSRMAQRSASLNEMLQ